MKRILTFLLIFTTTLLVACGNNAGDDNANANSGNDSTNDTEFELTFTVEGAVEADSEGNVSVFCDDGDGISDSFIELGWLSGSSQLILTVPTVAEAGTVDVVGSDDIGLNMGETVSLKYRDEDRVTYNTGTGELVIESMPTAEGEQFIATLTAELTDDDGNTITISANYDANAGTQSFTDCTGE